MGLLIFMIFVIRAFSGIYKLIVMIEFLHSDKEVEKALNRAYLVGVNEGVDRQQRANVGLRTAPSGKEIICQEVNERA